MVRPSNSRFLHKAVETGPAEESTFYRIANSVAMRSRPCLSLRRRKAELNFGLWFHKDLGICELAFDRRVSITRRKAELRACWRCKGTVQTEERSVVAPPASI